MLRRPLCLACILLMAVMWLADWMGIPLIRGNPLPDSVKAWIAQHPDAVVCGEAVRCTETEYSQSIYLKHTYLIVRSKKIPIENIRIYLEEKQEVPVGTVLLVSGNMERIGEPRNPGEFDSQQYYASERMYYFMKKCKILKSSRSYSLYGQFLNDVRQKFQRILSVAAGKDAPVFEAILLGQKENLDDAMKIRYQMAGIIHILAISGLHISLLGMGLYKIMKKAGAGIWGAGLIALVIMLQYGLMTGGSVSTMRAVCMFLLSVGAKLLGRCYDLMTALSFSGIMLLLDSPAYLYNSSFLLSFGAVLGIGICSPILNQILGKKRKILLALGNSMAVQLTTLPVVLWFYGEVSVSGVLWNLLVLPTVGIVLASGIAGTVIGLLSLEVAKVVFVPGRILLWAYESICLFAGKLPFCTWIAGKPFLWQVVVYYVVFVLVIAMAGNCLKKCSATAAACAGGLCLGVLILFFRPLNGLKITCLDVGQGDGIVIQEKDYCFLIDGGSSSKKNIGQYQLLPFLKSQGISFLDLIFLSHTDEDHISGVRQLLEFIRDGLTTVKVGGVVFPRWNEKTELYTELEKLALEAGVDIRYAGEGDGFCSGGIKWSFYAPFMNKSEDVNENSMVMELEFGSFRALFTGDIGEETEKFLLPVLRNITFLKTAHHGSKYSTGESFLEITRPKLAIISCSEENIYGHPSPDTVERLKDAGSLVEFTMKKGAITVWTDGKRFGYEGFVK